MSTRPGPRLGKGLAALLGDVPATAPVPTRNIAIDLLDPSPFQPRGPIEENALDELTASIRQQGVLQPILIRPNPAIPGRYQIIAGERRWRASQRAGLHEMPVHVRELADHEAMAAAMVENLQRQDLNAVEEAEGLRRLLEEFALTQEQLAEAVGKSRSHIANSLRLLALPEKVKNAMRAGTLTAGHARALLAVPDPTAAAEIVIARGLNVRQTELFAQAAARGKPTDQPGKPEKPVETRALEAELSQALGLRVEISGSKRGGTIAIHYRQLDQLDGLISLLRARH